LAWTGELFIVDLLWSNDSASDRSLFAHERGLHGSVNPRRNLCVALVSLSARCSSKKAGALHHRFETAWGVDARLLPTCAAVSSTALFLYSLEMVIKSHKTRGEQIDIYLRSKSIFRVIHTSLIARMMILPGRRGVVRDAIEIVQYSLTMQSTPVCSFARVRANLIGIPL